MSVSPSTRQVHLNDTGGPAGPFAYCSMIRMRLGKNVCTAFFGAVGVGNISQAPTSCCSTGESFAGVKNHHQNKPETTAVVATSARRDQRDFTKDRLSITR